MSKRIDVEDILRITEERAVINRLDFADITFYKDGKPLKVDEEAQRDFKFMGLSNTDFITSDLYKGWHTKKEATP